MSRFTKPIQGEQVDSEYDFDSSEIEDLVSRQPDAFAVFTFNIGLALGNFNDLSNRLACPGYGFAIYGFDTVTKAKYSEAYIQVAINSDGSDPSQVYPGKTGRGYHGVFSTLAVAWPLDTTSTSAIRLIIFKSNKYPWIGGETAL